MNQVMISTDASEAQVQYYINQKLNILYLKPYKVKTNVKNNITFITYIFKEEVYSSEYITPIAKGIMDFIQYDFAREYARQLIHTYYNLTRNESNQMIQMLGVVEEDCEIDQMVKGICQEIQEKRNFCVTGWMRFRLEGYKKNITKNIDRLIFEYLAYQEYEVFIELLRQFIETQPCLMSFLHVMPNEKGKIGLYNKNYEEISTKGDCILGEEDMMLSTLLTISPLAIRIHKKEIYENKRLIETIEMIYGDKISFCRSCQYCKETYGILTPKKQ